MKVDFSFEHDCNTHANFKTTFSEKGVRYNRANMVFRSTFEVGCFRGGFLSLQGKRPSVKGIPKKKKVRTCVNKGLCPEEEAEIFLSNLFIQHVAPKMCKEEKGSRMSKVGEYSLITRHVFTRELSHQGIRVSRAQE